MRPSVQGPETADSMRRVQWSACKESACDELISDWLAHRWARLHDFTDNRDPISHVSQVPVQVCLRVQESARIISDSSFAKIV